MPSARTLHRRRLRRGLASGTGFASAPAHAVTANATASPRATDCSGTPAGLGQVASIFWLIELCCAPDSLMSALACEYQINAIRVTANDSFDTAAGAQRVVDQANALEGSIDMWAALPCTPWCTWSYIDESILGPAFCARLAYLRRVSLRMVRHTAACFRVVVAKLGKVHFEWPRYCRGWQRRTVRQLVAEFGLFFTDYDRCQFGVMATRDPFARKPQRVGTAWRYMHAAFHGRFCAGGHQHGTLRGKACAQAAYYTHSLCRCALGAIAARRGHPCYDNGSAPVVLTYLLHDTASHSECDRASRTTAEHFEYPSEQYSVSNSTASVYGLLRLWVDGLLRSEAQFPTYARRFTVGELLCITSRCRDALPLPRVDIAKLDVSWASLPAALVVVESMINIHAAALHVLNRTNASLAIPRTMTSLHRAIFQRMANKLRIIIEVMSEDARVLHPHNAFNQIFGRGASNVTPDLIADAVDVATRCGHLNPMLVIPEEVKTTFMNPHIMFPNGDCFSLRTQVPL